MIKKLLILSSLLITIGFVGTLLTSKNATNIINVPPIILDITNSSGSNTVSAPFSDHLKISYSNSNGKSFHDTFTFQTTNDSIIIKEKQKEQIQFFSSSISSKLTISGISNQIKNLSIQLVSTDLNLLDIEAEKISITSVSGDLDLSNIQATNINLEAISGDMNLIEINGALQLDSTSGDIDLTNNQLAHSIFGSTISGDISLLFTEQPSNVDFSAKTVSGDVQFLNQDTESIQLGNASIAIKLNSISGDITLR